MDKKLSKTLGGRIRLAGLIIILFSLFIILLNNKLNNLKLTENILLWEESVKRGDIKRGIKLAKDICGRININTPPPEYISACERHSINPKYLIEDFNDLDFQHWNNAFFFFLKAKKIIAKSNTEDPIQALATAVHNRIESVEPKDENMILWPYTIWTIKKGLCDRQAWVLCELAYQLGYETQIVWLMNVNKISPHTICEIRKKDQTWVVDPFSNIVLKNTSIADIAFNPLKAKAVWPLRKDWQKAIENAIYCQPSFPQDYCLKNQLLQKKIKSVLKENSPRFGEPPIDRSTNYFLLKNQQDKKITYQFWLYPFWLLKRQMRIKEL